LSSDCRAPVDDRANVATLGAPVLVVSSGIVDGDGKPCVNPE
jgi:hypothetical protein